MFNNFSDEAKEVIFIAIKEMKELKHPYIGSEHLLLGILKHNNKISRSLKNKITYKEFKKEIIKVIGKGSKETKYILYTPLLKRIINSCNGTLEGLFNNLITEGDGVALRLLIGMNIDLSDMRYIRKKEMKILNKYGVNLNKQQSDPVIGRDEETNALIEILCRKNKNNPILIGEAGVGKTAIVENLSKKIENNEVPLPLRNKKIISIDISSLVAGTKYRGEFEEKINRLIKEVELNDDVILFIDEIHCIVGAGGSEGAIDASNIFKPALARGKVRLIGATTTNEYKKYIEKDEALSRRFQRIDIKEPTKNMTKKILYSLKSSYEKYHHVILDKKTLDSIVNLSEKYIKDRHEPDKSLDILDEVCSKVSLKETKELKEYDRLKKEYQIIKDTKRKEINDGEYKKSIILKEKENNILDKMNKIEINVMKKNRKVKTKDILELISYKTKLPLLKKVNINKKMKSIIIGQDNVIDRLTKDIKKIKMGYSSNIYMFVGEEHVGKKTLAKEFGEYLVGSENIKYKLEYKPNTVVILDHYEELDKDKLKDKNIIVIMICNREQIGFIKNKIINDNTIYFNKLDNETILNNRINKIKNKYKNIKININSKNIDLDSVESKIIDSIVENKKYVNI